MLWVLILVKVKGNNFVKIVREDNVKFWINGVEVFNVKVKN